MPPGEGSMAGLDDEVGTLRLQVDCRRSLTGRSVIVTHEGKGWFDPPGSGRGNVLALAKYIWGGSLGHVRQRLRSLAGVAPSLNRQMPRRSGRTSTRMFGTAPQPGLGSACWRYLIAERRLSAATVS